MTGENVSSLFFGGAESPLVTFLKDSFLDEHLCESG